MAQDASASPNPAPKGQLLVEAIANGTVIDHIAPGQALNILRMFPFLGKDRQHPVTVGFNLRSGQLGAKDIIKISEVVFSPAQTAQLAILSPNATVNQIENFKVVDKYRLRLPQELLGHFRCPNGNCITHVEQGAQPRFKVSESPDGRVQMKCHYCERVFEREVLLNYNGLNS